ncbi:serine/threonine protein kinase [Ktedonospora formicarum]|uniref:non-specific serine/threonine protein kinase n=1 Tax=Ktedonospora formicarum TaxID=2778364 RepID=A0A8J3HZM0_9CHLR|nr:serine/threonine-protein kinase [Ktedonospora formicarum]GHO44911.1 hypothetical protein KSX_30740 [Ktedonospora formicarum]
MITDDELLGTILGNYYITKRLGHGGMSVIYSAKTLQKPTRSVAIKVLRPSKRNDGEDFTNFLERFRREAKIIARLDHPHIVPIYDYGEERHLAYIVMRHEESSLDRILNTKGRLTLRETNNYLRQISEALDYAHDVGIIHRDLKPSNILLTEENDVELADFGISRIRMSNDPYDQVTLTRYGMVLGTPAYMAPEMFRTRNFDASIDIYALGIILYEMLSGDIPFKEANVDLMEQHMHMPLPSLHEQNHNIPGAVDQVLRKAAAKRPEDRYKSARELARAFQQAIQPGSRSASPSGTRQYYYGSRSSDQHNAVRAQRPHHINAEPTPPLVREYSSRQPSARSEPVSNRGASRPPHAASSRPGNSRPPHAVSVRREPVSQPGRRGQANTHKPRTQPRRGGWGWLVAALIAGLLLTLFLVYANHPSGSPRVPDTTPITQGSPVVTPLAAPTATEAESAYNRYNQDINQRRFKQAYQMLGPHKMRTLTLEQFTTGYANTVQQSIRFKEVKQLENKNQFHVEVIISATEKGNFQHTYDWQGTLTRLSNGSWQIDDYTQKLVTSL